MKKTTLLILISAFVIHLFFLLNLKFTAWPEMLAWPYLLIKGWLPYRDIAIAHTPLLIIILSLFYKIVGIGVWQIKIFSWLLILISDVVIYLVVKKLSGFKTAIIALLVYIPMQILFEGNSVWFDYLLAPLALLTFYFIKQNKYLAAGILWSLAFFTKQTAVWFLPGIAFLFFGKDFWYKVKEFICGALIPTTIIFLSFWLIGILPNFLFWAFVFGIGILPSSSGQIALPILKTALINLLPFSILLLGLFRDKKKLLVIGLWSFLGILGVYPRWELFHFQPGLPYLAIGIAFLLVGIKKSEKVFLGLLAIYFLGLLFLVSRFVVRDWRQNDRFLEPSVVKTAQYIKSATAPEDKIFVLNSWDSLYALADRLPATKPLFPQLSWYLALPGTEDEIVSDLIKIPPVLITAQPYTETGLSSFKPKKITDYIFKYYEQISLLDNSFFVFTPNK